MNIEQLRKRPISVTMKVDEKVAYARDIYPLIIDRVKAYFHKNLRKLKNMQHYPYTIVKECPMGNRGTWLVVITITKSFTCDFEYSVGAYYPFVVTNAKNPENNGLGFFNICPSIINDGYLVKTYDDSHIHLDEISPHVINRMIQRGGRDLLNYNVMQVCKHIYKITRCSMDAPTMIDVESYGVKYKRTVMTVEGGQFLGLELANRRYSCILTYISESEMKPSQKVLNMVLQDVRGKSLGEQLDYYSQKYDFDTILKIRKIYDGKDEKVRLDKIWKEIMGENA